MQDNLTNYSLFKITQNIFLLNKNNEFLILKHKSGKWLLPGGRLEIGESWLKGLIREIKEETGINNFKIKSIFQVDTWEYKGDSYFGIFYIGKTDINQVILSVEHIDYKWIKTAKEIDLLDFWNDVLKNRLIRFIDSK
jgi:8-oxo-dGTP pyrophosphatase MutT (NUDIX family)